MASNEEIYYKLVVDVTDQQQIKATYVIVGDTSIKWGKTAIYNIECEQYGVISNISNVRYSISDDSLASLEQEDGIAYVKANNKRKIGKILLTASGENFSAEKQISITSLW